MIMLLRNCLFLSLIIFFSNHALAQGSMSSPWDKNSIKSLSRNYATQKQEQYSCPSVPDVPANLKTSGIYTRSKDNSGHVESEIDKKKKEAYGKSIKSFRVAALQITSLADKYRLTGNDKYAECASKWLNTLADNNSLNGKVEGFQSYLTQSWMLSAYSIAWLKIRDNKSISADESKKVLKWLTGMAEKNSGYYESRSSKHKDSNVVYWGGLAAVATGIAADRQDLYKWGISRYKSGIDSLTPEGILPTELIRGKRALYYHIFAAIPLIGIAELAQANGDDLYNYRDHSVDKLVHQIIDSLNGNSELLKRAGQKQAAISSNLYMGWLRLYNDRFPTTGVDKLLKKYPKNSYVAWGGEAPPRS